MTTPHSRSAGSDEFRSPQPLIAGRPYFAASIIPLITGLVGLTPPLASWLVGAAIASLGALRSARAIRKRTVLRRFADEQLVSGTSPTSSPLMVWRASELVSTWNRRVLARSLRSIVAEAGEPRVRTSSPVNRRGVGPHLDLVRALALRVGTLEEPANPRGMALVEQLICDGFGSLYVRDKAGLLRGDLECCLSALELPRDGEPTVTKRFTVSPTRQTSEAYARARAHVVVRDRGRR
jgi:hypothetical protein